MIHAIWKGNYLDHSKEAQTGPGGWGMVTLVRFVGDDGECLVWTAPENTLPFKPQWYPMSLRGFHQGANVPPEFQSRPLVAAEDGPGETRWNARLLENGAVSLHPTREARDAYLRGDECEIALTPS